MSSIFRASATSFILGAAAMQWTKAYRSYRVDGRAQTAYERELMQAVDLETMSRHYNERVPTVEEEFAWWGQFHQHRHEMRYDLVAEAVRQHLPPGGRIVDVGAGAGLVADRVSDLKGSYVGLEFSERNVRVGAEKFAPHQGPLTVEFLRGDGERMPFPDGSVDVVVMSEVIEHLLRPDRAVREVSRILREGGVFVMTTNNASEMPCTFPLRNPLAYLEKALGAYRPELISLRPWAWPGPVDADLLPPGVERMHVPHTHHIYEETRRLFEAAGLETFEWSTFEFPPPQSRTDQWLEARGDKGKRVVDAIEYVCQRIPLLNRMGCHLLMQCRKTGTPASAEDIARLWPGPD